MLECTAMFVNRTLVLKDFSFLSTDFSPLVTDPSLSSAPSHTTVGLLATVPIVLTTSVWSAKHSVWLPGVQGTVFSFQTHPLVASDLSTRVVVGGSHEGTECGTK